MKSKIITLVLTLVMLIPLGSSMAQINGPAKNAVAEDPCTRAWAVAYNQISDEYTGALIGCMIDVIIAWIPPQDLTFFTEIDCANVAYWNYANALDAAADQYQACLGQ